MNYILAVTTCNVTDFLIGTYIGIIPGTATFLYVGVNLQSIQQIVQGKRQASTVEILLTILGLIVFIFCVDRISREAKK